MADKKGTPFFVGLGVLLIGLLWLLEMLEVFSPFMKWWLPVIGILVAIMVIINRKGAVNILGWILLIGGLLQLVVTLGILDLNMIYAFPATLFWFGLILIL